MLTELTEDEFEAVPGNPPTIHSRLSADMPASIVLTERAVAAFKEELIRRGLGNWSVFYTPHSDLYDVENHLSALNEIVQWVPMPGGLAGGETLETLTFPDQGVQRWPVGVLWLKQHQVAIARWYWVDSDNEGAGSLSLCAAATPDHILELKKKLTALRRDRGGGVWQLIRSGYDEQDRIPRKAEGPELMLTETIRQRIEMDVLRFFSDEVVELYKSLGVPHRRGVLLHGPPGNGKTSMIRHIGALLPDVPGLILRPHANFDSDNLESVVRRWTSLAPAILVIEDLDWLLRAVNISTFLNTLDGITSSADGMLLLATTNHPELLDPAINNRPGRFDVCIEMPHPEKALREKFFALRLAAIPGAAAATAAWTDGLSFAHLQEVLRLSGLLTIKAGRKTRTMEDLKQAAEMVQAASKNAKEGFATPPETPFGLTHRKKRREIAEADIPF